MQDQNIIQTIQAAKLQGKTKEEIYKDLLIQGLSLENIEENYKASNEEQVQADSQKRTISIIVTIGAVLIGAGIFSFIASNWQTMPNGLKVSTIIFFMLVAYSLGWYLKEYKDAKKTGGALILLGSIIFGAGIFLIGQMFNIRTNWPDAFIIWMIGIICLAFAIESYSLLTFAGFLAFIAIFSHITGIFENFSGFGISTFLIIISTIITFGIAFIIQKKVPEEIKNIY